jgi:hypothetical protein
MVQVVEHLSSKLEALSCKQSNTKISYKKEVKKKVWEISRAQQPPKSFIFFFLVLAGLDLRASGVLGLLARTQQLASLQQSSLRLSIAGQQIVGSNTWVSCTYHVHVPEKKNYEFFMKAILTLY